jgi:predicted chitinase
MPRNELGAGIPWGLIHGRAGGNMLASVNRFFQKYLGASRQRHCHALGQIFVETDHLNTMSEYGGSGTRYAPYYGRGLMQLTWQNNYTAYGTYAGLAAGYDPNTVAQAPHAGESAGFYWVSKEFFHTSDLNRVCDLGLGGNDVGFVSWLVNGGGNGYQLRELYARYTRNVLLDDVPLSATETFSYPPLSRALESTFPPSNPPATATVQVNYAQQIP